ncbi:hypothetical protein [Ruminococcus sp. YRD2003]|uniref:hypothetical protein n=1 Tax=Ruminococcus sp. YRD2003 TaxID=1452313 RepID=UPI00115F9369
MSAKAYEALSKSNELTTANETAQSPKQKNDGDEKERKKRLKGSLIKFGSLAVFAFVVWIFATISWFSSNSTVSGNGMGVSVASPPFELEVRGNYIENNDDEEFSMADNEYSEGVDMDTLDAFQTSGQYGKIIWRKTGANADDGHYSDGLVPNSHGKLTFWVVPNNTGTLDISFNFNIRGFIGEYEEPENEDDDPILNDLLEITDSLTVANSDGLIKDAADLENKNEALEFIRGHILFFSDYNPTTHYYSGFLGTGRSIRFGDCINASGVKYNAGNAVSVTSGQKYPVTIYWKWANTFEQMVYDANSPKKDNPLFAPSPNDDRTAVFTYLSTTKNSSEMTNKVFKGLSNSEVTSALSNVQNNTANIDSATHTLTDAYNNADSFIGNNVDYILIEMTASLN